MESPKKESPKREVKLLEFRKSVQDILPLECLQDDAFLLRWLVAREFNLDKARVMLQNYIIWKESNDINKILEWSPPEEMKEACPFQILGEDMEGRPILLFPWGKWKPWIFTEKFLDIYQKYMDFMIHTVLACLKPGVTQFVILADSDGFTYAHMKYIKALEINLEAVKQFERYYPELLHSAVVINCPRAFTVLYSLIKPLITKRTRDKISIFGNDNRKWKQFLAERIPRQQLPLNYQVDESNAEPSMA